MSASFIASSCVVKDIGDNQVWYQFGDKQNTIYHYIDKPENICFNLGTCRGRDDAWHVIQQKGDVSLICFGHSRRRPQIWIKNSLKKKIEKK